MVSCWCVYVLEVRPIKIERGFIDKYIQNVTEHEVIWHSKGITKV